MTVEIKDRAGRVIHVYSGDHLSGAYLRDADLRSAYLSGADLSGADLRDADLYDADLRDADLSGADLRRADLRDADLYDADLRGADLSGADLRDADLRRAGIVILPVEDPRGYRLIATQPEKGNVWKLTAGCRGPWTTKQAHEHWGAKDYPDKLIASRYLSALDWWEKHGREARKIARRK